MRNTAVVIAGRKDQFRGMSMDFRTGNDAAMGLEDMNGMLVEQDAAEAKAPARNAPGSASNAEIPAVTMEQNDKGSGDLVEAAAAEAMAGALTQVVKAAASLNLAPHLRWIAVGEFEHRLEDVVRLMKLGAADVLSNPDLASIADASQAALALARPEPERSPAPESARQRIEQLSRREREVLNGLVSGGTNKSIAQNLLLSPRTVETHRAHLMDRLGVSTLAELVRLASDAGI
ncbi:MAG: hypothetical protein EON96_01915 [Caulobacteraceae bacterium]|nr:MAG: hypothetical protein EON96_01915 [Caulobacteraceae bacterium]